ncbi:protein of unknown function-containing protein [Forsythia ovata]|uniref:Uncharacterized protein n=1 Tax=Forsythia ovata TaxID=205694 RepID=A0ABD1UW66_9LAMI
MDKDLNCSGYGFRIDALNRARKRSFDEELHLRGWVSFERKIEDVELHRTQQSPPQFLSLALGCVTVVTVDMSFSVKAQLEGKFHEKLFSAVKICQMEITSTTFVDNAMPSKNVFPYEDESENEDELWISRIDKLWYTFSTRYIQVLLLSLDLDKIKGHAFQ